MLHIINGFFYGLKLGLFLQAGAAGSICLLLLQLSMMTSLSTGMFALLGVLISNAIFILCAPIITTSFIVNN